MTYLDWSLAALTQPAETDDLRRTFPTTTATRTYHEIGIVRFMNSPMRPRLPTYSMLSRRNVMATGWFLNFIHQFSRPSVGIAPVAIRPIATT